MTVCSLIQSWRPISRFESPRHRFEDGGLALAQRGLAGDGRRSGLRLHAPDGEGAAGERRAEHGGQVDGLDGLDHVAAGAAAAGRLDLLRVAVAREDHDGDVRVVLLQPLEAGEAVELGHAQVEQDDVGDDSWTAGTTWLPTETSCTISKSSASASARRTAASISRWSSATSTRRVFTCRSPFICSPV